MIWFKNPSKKNKVEEKYERCVICGDLTGVLKETPIEFRDHYEIGCGQLCFDCFQKTESDPSTRISNASMQYLLKCCRKDTET